MVFTDDYTRWRYVCPMKKKGQAKDELIRFIHMIPVQLDKTVQRIRIDNGKEFGGQTLIDGLRDTGIAYEATVPYGPEQNGVAERSNGLIAARARAMILDSGVPHDMWPEAVKTACYLLHRLPTTAIRSDKVPLQLLLESRSESGTADAIDLSHLRSFGCTAYVHIPKEKRRQGAKFEPRSNKGVLVGYEGRNQYRIWLLEEGKEGRVVRARDVVFDEGPDICELDEPHSKQDASNDASGPSMHRKNAPHQPGSGTEGRASSAEQGGVTSLTPNSLKRSPKSATPFSDTRGAGSYSDTEVMPRRPPKFEEKGKKTEEEIGGDDEEDEDLTNLPPNIDIAPDTIPRRSGRTRTKPTKFGLGAIVALPAVNDAFVAAATNKEKQSLGEDSGMDPPSGNEPGTYEQAVLGANSKL